MEKGFERPCAARHPINTLILIMIGLTIISGALIFAVVGSFIGLPLMAVAFLTGFTAWYKFRQRWHPHR